MIAAQVTSRKFWLTAAGAGVLLALLCVACDLRMARMLPADEALLYAADYDEGVHVAAGQLVAQGLTPYRDFLFLQPPLAALGFAGVARVQFATWGDETTFALARYATIAAGLLTLVCVFLIAQKLGGTLAGLIATGVLAVDALVIATDRRAMLEPHVNLLSTLAMAVCLVALERRARRWMFGAGVLAALTFFTKTTGGVVALAIGAYLAAQFGRAKMLRRETRAGAQLLAFGIGVALPSALIAGYFLLVCPEQFLKQVYLIHFARVPDGVIALTDRVAETVNAPGSRLTLIGAGAGLAILAVRAGLQKQIGAWGLIVLWAGGVVALFAASRTYFPHYFAQLAVPLAILAGGAGSRGRTDRRMVIAAQIGVALIALAGAASVGGAQIAQARAIADQREANTRAIGRFLAANVPAEARVLALSPVYAILGSRSLAGNGAQNFLIDSYGAILYVNVGMEDAWMPEPFFQDIWSAIHFVDGQNEIVKAAANADVVVLDRQARWELTPETISAITSGYRQVFESGKLAVFAR